MLRCNHEFPKAPLFEVFNVRNSVDIKQEMSLNMNFPGN